MTGPAASPRCSACRTPLEGEAGQEWCPRCALGSAFAVGGDEAGLFRVPGHVVLAELGRGAGGIVYRARQEQPAREVALKIMRPHEAGSAESLARFRLETATVAALDHPVILPVLSVGEHDGLPYFTMKLCRGSLADRLETYRGRWREVAALVGVLAEAVHHAHAHGVLHRDLKPGNVLFDEADRPFISDFGLAKFIAGPAAGGPVTRPQLVMGTPGFLAPEILAGGAGQATTAGDVFALGAILHQLLTGEPPPATAAAEAPRPGVPRDLAVIAAHALAAEPGRRYASAEALAADLRAWLAGRPIAARPVSAFGRSWSWARRNPALAAVSAALFIALLAGAAGLSVQNRHLRDSLRQIQAAETQAQTSLADALVAQAHAVRNSGRMGQRFEALALLARAAKITGGFAVRSEAAAALTCPDLQVTATLPAYLQNNVFDELDFSPDLAWWASGTEAGGLAVRRTSDGAVVHGLAARSAGLPWFMRFSGDGRRVLALFNDERLHVWDIATEKLLFLAEGSAAQAPRAALSRSGEALAWMDGSGHLRVRRLVAGEEQVVGEIGRNVRRLSFSPDGNLLALVTEAGLEVWDVAAQRLSWRWDAVLARLDPAWTARGDCVAVSVISPTKEVVVLDVSSGQPRQRLPMDSGSTSLLAFFPDGRVLATVATAGELTLWDWAQNERLVRAPVGRNALRVAADGRRIGVAVSFQELGVMTVAENNVLRPWMRDQPSKLLTHSLAFSADGRQAATANLREVRLWDVAQGRELAALPFPGQIDSGKNIAVFFDPAGSGLLLNLGDDKMHRLEGLGGPAPVWREPETPADHELLGFLHGGRDWWVNAVAANHVAIWPEGDPRRARAATGPAVPKGNIWDTTVVSAGGRWVATAPMPPGDVLVWDATTATVAARFPITRRVGGDFSPDGRWLVLGTDQGYTVYDTVTWRQTAHWPVRLTDEYRGWVSFSPDGRWLALQVGRQAVQLRETEGFRAVINLESSKLQGRDEMAWSADSTRFCVAYEGHTVFEWNLPALERELAAMGLGLTAEK